MVPVTPHERLCAALDFGSWPAAEPFARAIAPHVGMLKVGLAFVTAVLLLNLLVGSRGLPAVLQVRREFERDQRSLDRLKAENAGLRQDIERLRNDAEAVEEVARRDLGYIEPGEKVFIIHDAAPPDAVPPRTHDGHAPEPSPAP